VSSTHLVVFLINVVVAFHGLSGIGIVGTFLDFP